jgi:hypothetical protein
MRVLLDVRKDEKSMGDGYGFPRSVYLCVLKLLRDSVTSPVVMVPVTLRVTAAGADGVALLS